MPAHSPSRSDWNPAGHDAEGPTTAFMALAEQAEAEAVRRAPPALLRGAPTAQPARTESLAGRVIAHLEEALHHELQGASGGWGWFERRWEEGRTLHARVARACLAAGPQPRAAIQDEDTGQWFTESVDLARPMPSAQQVVGDMLEIYDAIGVGALLMPECRRHPEYAGTVALASVFAVLDAKDVARALTDVLRAEGWLEPALWSRHETPRSLGRLLEFLASPELRRLLGRTVGARRAARHYARMMTRLVPGLGRKLLMADVLGLVFEQWNAPAEPPLRSLQSKGPRHLDLRPTLTGFPR
jgi:hypothetical protein